MEMFHSRVFHKAGAMSGSTRTAGRSGRLARRVGVLGVATTLAVASAGAVVGLAGTAAAGPPTVSYEADCTSPLEAGQVAPYVTTLTGTTTVATAAPTGAVFGFTGTAGTSIVGAFVAAIYAKGLGTSTLGLQWDETLGSTDGHALHTYSFVSPHLTAPDGGGEAFNVNWTSGSNILTGDFSAAAVGDAVYSNQAGVPSTATITAINGTTSATISQNATASATGFSVGYGSGAEFTTPISTGNVFKTNGAGGETAGIGVIAASKFAITAALTITFGGATGDGPANCLLTGYDASNNPGPGQTGGVTPPLFTTPRLPAGSTTPLVALTPNLVFPAAASVILNSAPTAPLGVTATGANDPTKADVSFSPPANDGGSPVTGYTVTAKDLTNPANGGQTASGASSPIKVPGLTTGDTYTFTVQATSVIGTGPASAPSNPVTPGPAAAPTAPTIGVATAGIASATVTWSPPFSDGTQPVTHYVITPSSGSPVTVGNVTGTVINGLTNGTPYTFTVAATNSVGTGPVSAASNSVTPFAPTVAGAPTIGTATAGNTTATVTWSPPISDGHSPVTGYVITPSGGSPVSVGDVTSAVVGGLTNGISYTFTVAAVNAVGTGPASGPSNAVIPSTPGGYRVVTANGGVFSHGQVSAYGSLSSTLLNHPIVGAASTPSGHGYWLVASDGGVFAYGDAGFYGSMGGTPLNKPIVGIASSPDGKGYWLVASDGGVFSFGDAAFEGSAGNIHLNEPIVGIVNDGSAGYWLVASDGGIFSFGAPFHGSTGNMVLNEPVNGMTPTADDGGYLFVASDGGIFAFGDATYLGSEGGATLHAPIVGMAFDNASGGYWLVGSDGGIFTFNAPFYGAD